MSDVTGSDAQQSGLDGLLQTTQYQVSSEPLNGEAPANEDTVTTHEGLSPVSSNSAEQPPVENQPTEPTTQEAEVPSAGTRNNEVPTVDPEVERIRAENEQLIAYRDNILRQQALQREQEFQSRLADMTPEERTIALQARRIQQLQAEQQRLSQVEQQTEAQRQEVAKRTLSAVIMSEYGLPPFAQGQLLLAKSPEHMEQIAAQVKADFEAQYVPKSQQATEPAPQVPAPAAPPVQQEVTNPFAAGGANGGTLQIEPPEIGSGDLDKLLSMSQYEVKSQF